MQLVFSCQGKSWTIRLNEDTAQTRQAFLRCLPLQTQIHTPKIAGNHIYWHAPFIADVEGATDVLDTQAGAFIYWPVRQFLEITFAPLQAETAQVTVLGSLESGVEEIAELANLVKHRQGHQIVAASLEYLDENMQGQEEREGSSVSSCLPEDIASACQAVWHNMPEDIAHLTQSRAIMHPVGPVLTAESQMRVLHEFLWWIRAGYDACDEAGLRMGASIALNKAATVLRDFCHLRQTPALLFQLEALMGQNLPFASLIDETILVSGRLSAWLDLLIPWHELNEAFIKKGI